jgi:hypothetical protein
MPTCMQSCISETAVPQRVALLECIAPVAGSTALAERHEEGLCKARPHDTEGEQIGSKFVVPPVRLQEAWSKEQR